MPAMPNWNIVWAYKGKQFVRVHHDVATFRNGRVKYVKADHWDLVNDDTGQRVGLRFKSKDACKRWVNGGIEERIMIDTWTSQRAAR